ncbi:hypothetical protein C0058_03820 [Pseudomonas sp. NC02]|nr:hypothetical protein C0058_03820 [Pseudomonas sp. NC02]
MLLGARHKDKKANINRLRAFATKRHINQTWQKNEACIESDVSGAAGFYDSSKKHYAFTLRSASGADFVPELDYIYSSEAAQAWRKASMCATSAEVEENVRKPISADTVEMPLKKIS